MQKFKFFFEKHFFGVCARLGEKTGISTERIRLFFIYTSFIGVGSPVIIYLTLAFVMNLRRYWRQRRNPVFR